MARSMLSLGMFSAFALSTASASRAFMSGEPPPSRAAIMMSRVMRAQILDRFASAAPFFRLIFDHLL